MKTLRKIGIAATLAILLNSLQGCTSPSHLSAQVQYSSPLWAPPYYAGVRYYYLPDIEVYYDLSDQEFVYLDDGQWIFSPVLPAMYSWYDLYNGFVIALDIGVYQPWLYHHYYVSHYPRYYYRNYYNNKDISAIRGFNENARKPFYWRQEDRDRIVDLKKSENKPVIRKTEPPRQPQHTNYFGKNIGHPVRVTPQMRGNREGNRSKR